MKQEYIIKKNIFGGFNRADVIKSLANLTESNKARNEAEQQTLLNKTEDLNRQISERNKKIEEYLSNDNINSLKAQRKNAVQNADEVLDAAKKEVDRINSEISSYIDVNKPKIEQLEEKTAVATEILYSIKANLHQLSEKLDCFDFQSVSEISASKIKTDPPEIKHIEAVPDEIITVSDEPLDAQVPLQVTASEEELITEKDNHKDTENVVITDDFSQSDSFNSIDNFFAEMDKLIAAKKNPEPYLSVINENPIEHLE